MWSRLLKQPVAANEPVFYLWPSTYEYWQIASELRGDFSAATMINYLGRIMPEATFRERYREFLQFADGVQEAINHRNR